MLFGIAFILAFQQIALGSSHHCVLRGICGKDPTVTIGKVPMLLCADEGPPNEMPEKLKRRMRKVCPHFETEISASKICCTRRQIIDLESNFASLEAVAGHCPTCLYNLKKVFCDFTCHPEQSRFLNASKKIWGKNSEGEEVEMVKELDYYVDSIFSNEVYNACKDVLFPSQSSSILPFICGTPFCSPKKLLEYMGTPSSVTSPFLIQFFHSEDDDHVNSSSAGLEYYNPRTLPCNVPPPGALNPCSCTNCELSCPSLDFSIYPRQTGVLFHIGELDGLTVVMGAIFIAFSIGFIAVLLFMRRAPPPA
uniref:Niemann-Pick C1 protein n=1 Tax=Caligus clemensi TaxID=344056 RepID=C1C2X5_CALCM|nr:Niemann-Pick C1 protein precursor [Caligus clemensi]